MTFVCELVEGCFNRSDCEDILQRLEQPRIHLGLFGNVTGTCLLSQGTARLTERKVVQERKGAIGSQGWDIYKIARPGVEKSDYMCYRKERWADAALITIITITTATTIII